MLAPSHNASLLVPCDVLTIARGEIACEFGPPVLYGAHGKAEARAREGQAGRGRMAALRALHHKGGEGRAASPRPQAEGAPSQQRAGPQGENAFLVDYSFSPATT